MLIENIKQFKNKILYLITKKDKKDISNLFILGFIVGLFELIGLALIVLMIQVFVDTSIIESNKILNYIYIHISNSNIMIFIGLVASSIFSFYIIKLLVSIINAKKMAELTSNLYLDISKKLFSNYLNYYYRDFGKKNTAEINQMLVIEADNMSLMVANIIYLIVHIMIIILLYSYMVYIDYTLTFIVTCVLVVLGYMYKIFLNKKLISMGAERVYAVKNYMMLIKSTFSNYKFIKGMSGNYINDNLSESTVRFKKTRIDMLHWSEVPRLILEFVVIAIMIGILVFIKLKYNETEQVLLIVSAYALALFRMLPSLSRVLNSVNIISMYKKTLDIVHTEFQYKIENQTSTETILFDKNITINNIGFQYDENNKKILNNINYKIIKGDKIAISGESGSGKSTFMDILIGLHLPTTGHVLIDNKELNSKNIVSWRQSTSFVPQKVVLFESTIRENITFGKKYDKKLFNEVLKDVFLYDMVMEKGGIDIKVGDEISGFSGGQMQRIAFARALYQEREVLFLDEATSSLDEEVEIKIIDRLLSKYQYKTIIAIVHKKSIASKFDKVIDISHGSIVK